MSGIPRAGRGVGQSVGRTPNESSRDGDRLSATSGQGRPELIIQRTSDTGHSSRSQGDSDDGHPNNSPYVQDTMRQPLTLPSLRCAGGGLSQEISDQRAQNARARNEAPVLPSNVRRAVTSPRQNGRRRMAPRATAESNPHPEGVRRPPPSSRNASVAPCNKSLRANITIASLNINRGGTVQTRDKWQHVNQLLRDKKIGILAVQETHL
jgi:hypothetical protein